MNTYGVTYEQVRQLVDALDPAEQARLLEALATLVRRRISASSRRSIMELQGLGKEIWQDIDAQDYIDQERDSWNG